MADAPAVYRCPECQSIGHAYMVTSSGSTLTIALRCATCQHEWTEERPVKPLFPMAKASIDKPPKSGTSES